MRKSVLFILFAGLIFLAPPQARADLSYTMTNFQSLGQEYASGQIAGTLTGDLNISPLYSFCVLDSANLYQGQQYSATLASISSSDTGALESAYLMTTYAPGNIALPNTTQGVNQGVALQWAMWMALGQGSPITANGLNNAYPAIYSQAQTYLTDAQNASNLSQYAGMYQELQLQGSQNLLFVATPLPASILLFSPGLMVLAAARRRFQK